MPVGIRQRRGAGGVELRDLGRGQVPTDGAKVLAQLSFRQHALPDDQIAESDLPTVNGNGLRVFVPPYDLAA